MMPEHYITTAEAAKIIGCTQRHVRRLVASGKLIFKQIGIGYLILRSSAEAYDGGKPGLKLGQKINRKKKSKNQ